ncbi:MAG: acid--CoA ligase [Frankiales bacterium]|nr:acid--CoA ligase [Frankiales bacterium]
MSLAPTLGEHFGALAAQQPETIAITCVDQTITYGELERRSTRLARAYQAAGVTPDSLVTIGLPNSIEFYEALVAVWKCGATPQPVSHRLPVHEREAVIALAEPSLVIGVDPTEVTGRPVLPAGYEPDPSLDDGPLPPLAATSWKAPTSGGSTGRPKLIVSSQAARLDAVEPFARLLGMNDKMPTLITGPLYHNGPLLMSTCALVLGGHVVLMPRFDAATAMQHIQDFQIDWMYAVPTMMGRIWRLEDRESYDVSSLRIVMHLAAPCPPWLKAAWIEWLGPEKVWELYAATEVQAVTILTGQEWLDRPGTVGKTAIGEIKILDADGGPVANGTVGEVWMRRGEGVENPYRYIGAEARALDDGWESVGDMGYLDDAGYLFLADRKGDMILVGGANVYPAEIESALTEHPQVRGAVVIGLKDEDLGQVPHAFIEIEGELSDDDLRGHLKTRLVSYKIPRSFERVSEPLRDDAGKVRRSELVAQQD